LGEINQATLDASQVLNSAYPFPVHSPFPEGFATLNDICPSWKTQIGFINRLGNREKKGWRSNHHIFSERATDNPNRIWSKRLSPFRCQQEPSFEQN
jgi:hypothetical protein